MSDQDISIVLQDRPVVGKGVKKLRNDGFVPGVIHDHGKPSQHVMAEYQKIVKVYSEAGKHHPVELVVEGGKKNTAIIKEVNYDPVKHRLQHIVFQAIRQDEKVETEVPINIVNEVPAVKAGLMVINNLTSVAVEALPRDLPDQLEVDGSKLVEIGDKITIADLTVPSGVTVLSEPENSIAAVEETKAQISEESEEAEAEAGEEGSEEVEGSTGTESSEDE